jgi:uncharacterized membrane protein
MRTHPWHPVLVHFPIACCALAALVDAADLLGWLPAGARAAVPGVPPAALSFALLWLGVVFGVAAMVLGFVDYLRLPTPLQRGAALNWHIAAMTGAWALFLSSAWLRSPPETPARAASLTAVLVEVGGLACLAAGGWLASTVVFADWPPGRAKGRAD